MIISFNELNFGLTKMKNDPIREKRLHIRKMTLQSYLVSPNSQNCQRIIKMFFAV